jgi:uncharacterized membrane protein
MSLERRRIMSEIFNALSLWLHALATVVLIGNYLLLALIYIPVLKDKPGNVGGVILSEISKGSRGWLYVSLLIFLISGIYLMLADQNYLGFLNFGNAWSLLMLVKHVLILGMLVVGFWFNAILRVGPSMSSNTGALTGLERFQRYVYWMAILGVLVLFLTALSQVQ